MYIFAHIFYDDSIYTYADITMSIWGDIYIFGEHCHQSPWGVQVIHGQIQLL